MWGKNGIWLLHCDKKSIFLSCATYSSWLFGIGLPTNDVCLLLNLMKHKFHETWPSQPQSLMGKNTKSKSKTAATVRFFFFFLWNLHSPTLSCCRRKCLSVPVMPVTGWQEVNTNEWSFRLSWIVHLVGGCRTKPVSSPTHWDNQHYMPSKK